MTLDADHAFHIMIPISARGPEHGEDDHLVQDVAELEAAAHVSDRHMTHNDHADPFGA